MKHGSQVSFSFDCFFFFCLHYFSLYLRIICFSNILINGDILMRFSRNLFSIKSFECSVLAR